VGLKHAQGACASIKAAFVMVDANATEEPYKAEEPVADATEIGW